MIGLDLKTLAAVVGGEIISGEPGCRFRGVSTDSRTITRDMLFIPLKGERFDGHDFIEAAFSRGAAACLTEVPRIDGGAAVLVKDTMKAMHALAAYHRDRFDIPFIGITGSSGKTTTKDMIADVLGLSYHVLKNEANYNNFIGVPQTLFGLNENHDIGVIEMGMNSLGEIRTLARIVRPNVAVITNVGIAHIEKLGSLDNILKAKMEILEGLGRDDLAIINGDDPKLGIVRQNTPSRVVTFGIKNGDIRALRWETHRFGSAFLIELNGNTHWFELNVPGRHNIYNALAAIAVGTEFGIQSEAMARKLKEYSPGKMRMEKVELPGGPVIINDAYNANPDSVRAALETFDAMSKGQKRAVVLGDMLEMGELGAAVHREIGRIVAKIGVDYLLPVGEFSKYIAEGAMSEGMAESRIFPAENNAVAVAQLKRFAYECDIILFKASRGVKLEEVIKKFVSEVC